MVVSIVPICVLAISNRFSKMRAFWICAALGFIADLFVLTLPLGFYTFLCPLLSFIWTTASPYLPPVKSFFALPGIFLFFSLFSLLESIPLGYFDHPLIDFVVGPLIDCLIFGLLVLSALAYRYFQPALLLVDLLEKTGTFFFLKKGFFRILKIRSETGIRTGPLSFGGRTSKATLKANKGTYGTE